MYIDVPSEEDLPSLPQTEELHRHMLEFICKQAHKERGAWGGVTPPNVWKMHLELENHSLHLEFVCSMRTHF